MAAAAQALDQLLQALPADPASVVQRLIGSGPGRLEGIHRVNASVAAALAGEAPDAAAVGVLAELPTMMAAREPFCEWAFELAEQYAPGWRPDAHVDEHLVARFHSVYRNTFRAAIATMVTADVDTYTSIDEVVGAASVWCWLRPVSVEPHLQAEAEERRRLLIYELALEAPEAMSTALLAASIGVVRTELELLPPHVHGVGEALLHVKSVFGRRAFASAIALLASDEPRILSAALSRLLDRYIAALDAGASPTRGAAADLRFLWATLAVLTSLNFVVPAVYEAVLERLTAQRVTAVLRAEQRSAFSLWALQYGDGRPVEVTWLSPPCAAALLTAAVAQMDAADLTALLAPATVALVRAHPAISAAWQDAVAARLVPAAIAAPAVSQPPRHPAPAWDAVAAPLVAAIGNELERTPADTARIASLAQPLVLFAAAHATAQQSGALAVSLLQLAPSRQPLLAEGVAAAALSVLLSAQPGVADAFAEALGDALARGGVSADSVSLLTAVRVLVEREPALLGAAQGALPRAALRALWRTWAALSRRGQGDFDLIDLEDFDDDGAADDATAEAAVAAAVRLAGALLEALPPRWDPFEDCESSVSVVAAGLLEALRAAEETGQADDYDDVGDLLAVLCQRNDLFFSLAATALLERCVGSAIATSTAAPVEADAMDVDLPANGGGGGSVASSRSRRSALSSSSSLASSLARRAAPEAALVAPALQATALAAAVAAPPPRPLLEQNRTRRPLLQLVASKARSVTPANASSHLLAYVHTGFLERRRPLKAPLPPPPPPADDTAAATDIVWLLRRCCLGALPTDGIDAMRLCALAHYAAPLALGVNLPSAPLSAHGDSLQRPALSEREQHIAALLRARPALLPLLALLAEDRTAIQVCLPAVVAILVHDVGAWAARPAGSRAADAPALVASSEAALRLLAQAGALPPRIARAADVFEVTTAAAVHGLVVVALAFLVDNARADGTPSTSAGADDARYVERVKDVALRHVDTLAEWLPHLLM